MDEHVQPSLQRSRRVLTYASHMAHSDGRPANELPGTANAVPDQVEIISPVADALGVLADLIPRVPGSLAGASIAKSDHGTLLLNTYAWSLFSKALREALPSLVVAQPARDFSKPLRFVITAESDIGVIVPSADTGRDGSTS
jgi:hypothetical protein